MVICFFSTQYLPTPGGVERYTWNLARRCVAAGHRALVVTASLPGLPARERDADGIEIYRLPSWPVMGGRFPVLKPFADADDLWAQGIDFAVIQTRMYTQSVWMILNATASVDGSGSFRLRRIMVWLHPEEYADTWGYQTIQALYAIGSGGFFGRGLGNSIQKLGSVPEAQNDMIFSIICEELGIFGGLIVLMLYAYLLYRLFVIAQNAPDMFGSLMVSGIFIHIALQVILNIAVVVNLMPNTGVTLPFISYGGTSIVFLMAEMGLALSVARQIKFEE